MNYYLRENNGWTAFFCVPPKRPNQPLVRLGLRIDRMHGGSFHIDTIYEVSDDRYFEEGCARIDKAEFEAVYKQAIAWFEKIKLVDQL